MNVMKTSLTIIPMCPRERISLYKSLSRLVVCYKKDWAILLHFIYTFYLLPVTNYLLKNLSVTHNFSACREYLTKNRLSFPSAPHCVWHSYLSKGLWYIPYTCGSSRLFSGAVAEEWSALGKWKSVRKNYYYVLKFIVTCYYGEQSFEGFVRGIFTSTGTTISYPSTYYAYWKYWIWNSFGYVRTTGS